MPFLYLLGIPALAALAYQGTKDAGLYLSSDIATAPAQVRAVADQINKASRGVALRSIDSEVHDANWYEPPQTDAGANLRAAYWLAVGARLSGSSLLLGYAQTYQRAANVLLASSGDILGNPLATNAGAIQRTLYQAQTVAESAGRGDVAAQLDAIRRAPAYASTGIGAFLGDESARARTLAIVSLVGGVAAVAWVAAKPAPRREVRERSAPAKIDWDRVVARKRAEWKAEA
jgi:hypothetical protein